MNKIHRRSIPCEMLYQRAEKQKDEIWAGLQVAFYIVTWNNKNRHGEVFLKGSGRRSIQFFKDGRSKHFKNHNTEPPGVVVDMYEDDKGLVVVSELIANRAGLDTKVEYLSGQITEHSAGFIYVNDGAIYDEQADTIFIKDFELHEASSLNGWGSDSNTSVLNMNSAEIITERRQILEEYNLIQKKGIDYKYLINNY